MSFAAFEKFLPQLPADKHILVVCQNGYLSYAVAYYLKSKGFARVSSLEAGIAGWKKRHNDLYQRYAGHNVTMPEP